MTLLQNKFLKYYIGYNDFFDEIDKSQNDLLEKDVLLTVNGS